MPPKIKSVLEHGQEVMKKLADVDYDVVNSDLPFHIARARAQQIIEETITQDRQQLVEVVCGVLDGMKEELNPADSGSRLTRILTTNRILEDAKTAIKNLLDEKKGV